MVNDPRMQALQAIYDQWAQYPGRAPNGTGLTGLQKNDAQGWSDMLNQQTEAMRLKAELEGTDMPVIKQGGVMGSPAIAGLSKAMPEPHDQFMKRYGR